MPESLSPLNPETLPVAKWAANQVSPTEAARALTVAELVHRLRLDADSVTAAYLVGLPTERFAETVIEEAFGTVIAQLVSGARRMASMHGLLGNNLASINLVAQQAQQTEALRKMLLAMVDDVRVIFIKLAERLAALRAVGMSVEARRSEEGLAVAREVMEVYAPLANRLGVWQLKWELEDLSLRVLDSEQYHTIARYLDETRIEREAYIDTTKTLLRDMLGKTGIECEISGRPKHIYSIYDKLKRKRCTIEELYDIRALRVIVPELKDCYAALGVVHNAFQPVPGEFDDYIAKPKSNNYRSLHTCVIGPQNRAVEIQIRTREMHEYNEYGVAAHWSYKEGGQAAKDASFANKLSSLRQVLSWGNELSSQGELLAAFRSSLFDETVFVLSPQGRIIDLPRDSTPVDFAYAIHSGLGHRCRGAKVDGVMVPLNTTLKNGQRVEIITVKEGGPSRDWLNPDNGYIHSNRARAKVRQWFNGLDLQATLSHGRATVEKELQRSGQTALNLDRLAHDAGYKSLEEFFAAVGRSEINSRELDAAIRKAAGLVTPTVDAEAAGHFTTKSRAKAESGGILVVGVDKLMTGLAKCCKPVPPDPIVGFVSRLKGISIHRVDCHNVRQLRATEPDRIIDADWGNSTQGELFSVQIEVVAADRQGLLRDISDVLAREKINVTAVNTLSRDYTAKMKFTAEVRGLDQLQDALVKVTQVKGVQGARRL